MEYFLGFAVLIVGSLMYSFWLGLKALREASRHSGARAATLHFLALNLSEPLINFVIIFCLLQANMVEFSEVGVGLRATWPMGVLLLPVAGLGFRDAFYREKSLTILLLGGARWILNILVFEAVPVVGPFAALGVLCGVGMLWISITWGKTALKDALAPSPTGNPLLCSPAAVMSPTRTAPGRGQQTRRLQGCNAQMSAYIANSAPLTYTAAVLSGLRAKLPALPCPICRQSSPPDSEACPCCGLVFLSRVPLVLLSLSRYEILRPLERGGMSSVYLAKDTLSARLCVLKTLVSVEGDADAAWYAEAQACLRREAVLLTRIEHRYVSHVLDWIDDARGSVLVLEYVEGHTLEEMLYQAELSGKTLSCDQIIRYGCQIADTLCYLASLPQPIVHCDIKPANLILPSGSDAPILVDFGCAVQQRQALFPMPQHERHGTLGYAAPEQYHGFPSLQSDVYGLAATLYHLLTADDPAVHPLEFPLLTKLPFAIAQMLAAALDPNPRCRPNAATFRAALAECARSLHRGTYQIEDQDNLRSNGSHLLALRPHTSSG